MNPITDEGLANQPVVADRAGSPSRPSISHGVNATEPRKKSIIGLLVKALMVVAVVLCAVIFGLYKMHVDIPSLKTPILYAHLDSVSEKVKAYYETHFAKHAEEGTEQEKGKIVVTQPKVADITITREYVCQIHSQNHIDVSAFVDGYLEAIPIKEGQMVKAGELMFQIVPILYKAELAAKLAERDYEKMELDYTQTLADKNGVSQKEVLLHKAKLARAQAEVDLSQAKLNFASIKAPFDGIIDKLKTQKGSLVKEGDMLTTLSDNSVMWVYFNVPEKRYLEYMAEVGQNNQSPDIRLKLADQKEFSHTGKIDPAHNIGAIEANFDNTNGNIAFRADFPNPDRLLRHGQTGTVLIDRPLKNALIIPQRATFEILDKRYVYVVDKDDVAHQRGIKIAHELDDIFVIEDGLKVGEKFVLDGVREVRDGQKVEAVERSTEDAFKDLKFHAE